MNSKSKRLVCSTNFGIRNPELGIQNSEFGIVKYYENEKRAIRAIIV